MVTRLNLPIYKGKGYEKRLNELLASGQRDEALRFLRALKESEELGTPPPDASEVGVFGLDSQSALPDGGDA